MTDVEAASFYWQVNFQIAYFQLSMGPNAELKGSVAASGSSCATCGGMPSSTRSSHLLPSAREMATTCGEQPGQRSAITASSCALNDSTCSHSAVWPPASHHAVISTQLSPCCPLDTRTWDLGSHSIHIIHNSDIGHKGLMPYVTRRSFHESRT